MPNNQNPSEFVLSCGCKLKDIAVAAGVVFCGHGRTIFAPGFADFVRERRPQKREMTEPDTDKSVADELEQLCDGVALDVLSEPDVGENIFQFALATVRKPLRSNESMTNKEIKTIEDAIAPFMPQLQAAEDEARAKTEAEVKNAAEFLGNWLGELCALPTIPVLNGRKSPKEKMFDILHHAIEELLLASEGDDGESDPDENPWEYFSMAVGRAGAHIDVGEHDEFRRAMIKAWKTASQHPKFSLVDLANEIRNAKYLAQERRLRLRIELRALGIIR